MGMALRSVLPSESFMRNSCAEKGSTVLGRRGALIAAVGLLDAGLDGVSEIGGKDLVVDARLNGGIANGEGHFATFEEIAGHPVSRAEVDFVVATIGKVEDAGVLKEAADDGTDTNATGEAFDSGAEDAEAADDEVDFNAGIGGIIERFDDAGLEERVHLGDDVCGAASAGVFSLAANEAEEALSHGEWGDEERAVVVDLGVRGEVVEDHVHAFGDLRDRR